MTKIEAFVSVVAALCVAGVLITLMLVVNYNAQEGKAMKKEIFSKCINVGGTYVPGYKDPVCVLSKG